MSDNFVVPDFTCTGEEDRDTESQVVRVGIPDGGYIEICSAGNGAINVRCNSNYSYVLTVQPVVANSIDINVTKSIRQE